jgi:multiple sugar transport system permease protein
VTSIPSTFTPNFDIYNTAFQFGAFNYAATLAILLTALTAVAAGVFLLVTGRTQGDAPWP